MRIFVNRDICKDDKKELKNGATKRTLVVINKTGQDIKDNEAFEGVVGTLNKGNHSFVFLNKPTEKSRKNNRTIFVLIDGNYGVKIKDENKIKFINTSVGGQGNSKSTIAVIEGETLIENYSYKNRSSSWYRKTDLEKGFVEIPIEDVITSGILGDELIEEV